MTWPLFIAAASALAATTIVVATVVLDARAGRSLPAVSILQLALMASTMLLVLGVLFVLMPSSLFKIVTAASLITGPVVILLRSRELSGRIRDDPGLRFRLLIIAAAIVLLVATIFDKPG